MPKVIATCDWCGSSFLKLKIELAPHNFCCRGHLYEWNRVRITEYNKTQNPMNHADPPLDLRLKHGAKLRDRGEGRTYRKFLGRHEHRIVAEQMLGRKLNSDEVVHHIDRDKRNNAPDNLAVMSREAHARIHRKDMKCSRRMAGGDVQ